MLGALGGGGLLGFAVLVVLGIRWAGLGPKDFVLEADSGCLGIRMYGGGGVDIVVGPLVVGVALVFGVEFGGAREACAVCGRARGLVDVGGVGDWSVVADGGEEDMEYPPKDVEVHGVASHAVEFGVVCWPGPAVGFDPLGSEGFVWSHQSAPTGQP